MAGREKLNPVQQDAIHVEMTRKERRHKILHTEFSINPHRKLHVLPDKPMSRKPEEVIAENLDFIESFHEARQEPTKKYPHPQTESQEIGWISTPLLLPDQRLIFPRFHTDIAKNFARSSNCTKTERK